MAIVTSASWLSRARCSWRFVRLSKGRYWLPCWYCHSTRLLTSSASLFWVCSVRAFFSMSWMQLIAFRISRLSPSTMMEASGSPSSSFTLTWRLCCSSLSFLWSSSERSRMASSLISWKVSSCWNRF
uniref:Uncharacterized protein n=1 Tax=Anguilla anguilla TaxID=7936 RepID=A0A0E9XKT2_ANGAN